MLKSIIVDQIAKELQANSNKSETLNKMFDQFSDGFILSCMNDVSKEIFENSLPEFELKQGMVIRSKVDLFGKSVNWGNPERINIPKGTTLIVFDNANNGDVFAELIVGTCHIKEKDTVVRTYQPSTHPRLKTVIILVEGQRSRHPYDFGLAKKDCWEIIPQ